MKKSLYKIFALLLICISFISSVKAQEIPIRPDPPKLVNDFTGILSADEVQQLESKLVAFNDSTSTQITVILVKSLQGYDKADFAYRIGQQWGVGQKGKNNGAVILVKPKTSGEKGEA